MNYLNKKRKIVIYVVVINIFILLFYLLFYYCKWRTNDDILMRNIVSGAFGNNDYHVVFINSIVGRFLSILYSLFANISWYELMHYLINFSSFSFLSYLIIAKKKNIIYLLIPIIVFAYQAYTRPQFTVTAAVSTTCGLVYLIEYINRNNSKYLLVGITFFSIGMMIRIEEFLACSFITAIFFLLSLVNIIKENNKVKFKKVLIVICLCTIILMINVFINKLDYASDEWKNYSEFNYYRSALRDGGFPSYEDNIDMYNSVNINSNAYVLFKNGNINDSSIFNIDAMKKIVQYKDKEKIDIDQLYNFANNAIIFSFNNKDIFVFTILILISILTIFITNKNKIEVLSTVFSGVAVIFCMWYVFYTRKDFPSRVVIGLYGCYLTLISTQYIEGCKIYRSIKINKVLSLMLIVLFFVLSIDNMKFNKKEDIQKQIETANTINILNSKKETLYLCCVGNNLNLQPTLLNCLPRRANDNICSLGDCITGSPIVKQQMEKYGINNPYKDVINNENVLIVDYLGNSIDNVITYIKDYYDAKAQYQCIDSIGDYSIYRIFTTD